VWTSILPGLKGCAPHNVLEFIMCDHSPRLKAGASEQRMFWVTSVSAHGGDPSGSFEDVEGCVVNRQVGEALNIERETTNALYPAGREREIWKVAFRTVVGAIVTLRCALYPYPSRDSASKSSPRPCPARATCPGRAQCACPPDARPVRVPEYRPITAHRLAVAHFFHRH